MPDTLEQIDITDATMLAAITETIRLRDIAEDTTWTIGASRWDLASVLAGHPDAVGGPHALTDWPGMPANAVLAKAQGLIDRGLIDGCACSCRGDFVVLDRAKT